jgi:hypothetical protein
MTDKTPGTDFIAASAVNFYARGLTFGEVEAWAKAGKEKNPLNSFVTKETRKIGEDVWRAGGAARPPGCTTPTYRRSSIISRWQFLMLHPTIKPRQSEN